MKVAVVECPCGNPRPHRKLRAKNGLESKGFFSVEAGKAIFYGILTNGEVEQTSEETAATLKELKTCGLPATRTEALEAKIVASVEAVKAKKPSEGFSMEVLASYAKGLVALPAQYHQEMVSESVLRGVFTAEEGKKILALVAEIKQE